MQDYQKRVIEEKELLGIKIGRLADYLNMNAVALGKENADIMSAQLNAMKAYYDILRIRIDRFE